MFHAIFASKKFAPTPSPSPISVREAIRLRANQLVDAPWSVIESTYPKVGETFFDIGEYTGLPYSSTRGLGKGILYDASYETFITATQNPLSIMYKVDLRTPEGLYVNADTAGGYYGIGCNEVVSYALGLKVTPTTGQFPHLDESFSVTQDAQHAEIGYYLLRSGHIAIISDVHKDDGNVTHVVVTEAAFPKTKRTVYSAVEFNDRLNIDIMYGFQLPEELEYSPFPEVAINDVLKLEFGNKAVYRPTEPVRFNVVSENAKTLIVKKDGVEVTNETISSTGEIEITYAEHGSYEAYCIMNDLSVSDSEEFEVSEVVISSVSTETPTRGVPFTVNFTTHNCKPLYVIMRTDNDVHSHASFVPQLLTEEEILNGSVDIVQNTSGNFYVVVVGENDFGRVFSNRYSVVVT